MSIILDRFLISYVNIFCLLNKKNTIFKVADILNLPTLNKKNYDIQQILFQP